MLFMNDQAQKYDDRADWYDSLIPSTRRSQILGKDTQKLFRQLNITGVKASTSETGAVTVEARFERKEEKQSPDGKSRSIYDSPSIDGTVAARLYRNGRLEASAYFVLPISGITTATSLTAISTKPTDRYAHYIVKFEPVDLWEIKCP